VSVTVDELLETNELDELLELLDSFLRTLAEIRALPEVA
jgi:hypothetical protein